MVLGVRVVACSNQVAPTIFPFHVKGFLLVKGAFFRSVAVR